MKTKSASIGAFVLGAVCLVVAMLILFGRGSVWAPEIVYRMYFDKSVKGLSVGAPVMFRGVRIGQVKAINMTLRRPSTLPVPEEYAGSWPIEVLVALQPQSLGLNISFLEILPERWLRRWGISDKREIVHEMFRTMITEQGMRAQLQSLSLLTGQLYLEFNLFPDDQSIPTAKLQQDFANRVLPTRMSDFERLFLSLGSADISGYLDNLYVVLDDFSSFARQGGFRDILQNVHALSGNLNQMAKVGSLAIGPVSLQLSQVLSRADTVVATIDGELNPLLRELRGATRDLAGGGQAALGNLQSLSDSSRELVGRMNQVMADNEGSIQQILSNLARGSGELRQTIEEARGMVQQMQEGAAPDAPLRRSLGSVLDELNRAAVSIRNLSEFLHNNPESMLRGKR